MHVHCLLNLSARAEKRGCILLYSCDTCSIYHAEIGLSKLPKDSLDITKVGKSSIKMHASCLYGIQTMLVVS